MRSRFLMELTTPEVEQYFSQGGKTALFPIGSVEMHGPHQPIGTDTLVAKAFALSIAESVNGLVLPDFHYTWAGSTDGFVGTISVEPDLTQKILESIAVKCKIMGFKNLIFLSVHAPNDFHLTSCVRRIFEKHLYPVMFINPYRPYNGLRKLDKIL